MNTNTAAHYKAERDEAESKLRGVETDLRITRNALTEAVALLRDIDAYLATLQMLKAVTGPSIQARHRNVCAFLASKEQHLLSIDGAK